MLSEIILNVSKLRFAHLDILKSSKVSIMKPLTIAYQ